MRAKTADRPLATWLHEMVACRLSPPPPGHSRLLAAMLRSSAGRHPNLADGSVRHPGGTLWGGSEAEDGFDGLTRPEKMRSTRDQ